MTNKTDYVEMYKKIFGNVPEKDKLDKFKEYIYEMYKSGITLYTIETMYNYAESTDKYKELSQLM